MWRTWEANLKSSFHFIAYLLFPLSSWIFHWEMKVDQSTSYFDFCQRKRFQFLFISGAAEIQASCLSIIFHDSGSLLG